MSFKKEDSSLISKRFVSENEIEEIKRKREEEWELARSEGRKIGKKTGTQILMCLLDLLWLFPKNLICPFFMKSTILIHYSSTPIFPIDNFANVVM